MYTQVYDEAIKKCKAAWEQEDTCAYDPQLLKPKEDSRRCLALYAPHIRTQTTEFKWGSMLKRHLSRTFSDVITYEPEGFTAARHTTLFQLMGFDDYEEKQSAAHLPIYLQAWEDTKHMLEDLCVCFNRICITRKSIVAMGEPNLHVNAWRADYRRRVLELGGKLWEPFETNWAHCTLVRFTGPLSYQKDLQELWHYDGKILFVVKFNVDDWRIQAGSWTTPWSEFTEKTE